MLRPETAWEYETGIIQSFKPLTLRGTFYFYDISDFMNDSGIMAPGTGLGSDCLYNIPSVKLYGVELEAALDFSKRFRGMVSYSYQAFDATDSPFQKGWSYYLPLLYPKHKIKAMGRARLWEDGWLQANLRFVSDRSVQKQEYGRLKAYATLDLGFEQKFRFWQQELTLNAFANNLTGKRYQEIHGYYMPRQTYGFTIGTKF
ncbi:MAG: TonB-dependent receptor [Deltaproteobacteria bacterium]|nr:TonB-dependent receptor [Deltaproteobacteria bacterium]MBW1952919.1 TonB-dependent receptor [Deltaproteobacteria bacterium]MBW1987465.1 TonB-dependent receptor [Deltaproteobacteria bacterium]MBW2135332.1 TonB-dependent receptor [Deltaproteobacteria bacterium]